MARPAKPLSGAPSHFDQGNDYADFIHGVLLQSGAKAFFHSAFVHPPDRQSVGRGDACTSRAAGKLPDVARSRRRAVERRRQPRLSADHSKRAARADDRGSVVTRVHASRGACRSGAWCSSGAAGGLVSAQWARLQASFGLEHCCRVHHPGPSRPSQLARSTLKSLHDALWRNSRTSGGASGFAAGRTTHFQRRFT